MVESTKTGGCQIGRDSAITNIAMMSGYKINKSKADVVRNDNRPRAISGKINIIISTYIGYLLA